VEHQITPRGKTLLAFFAALFIASLTLSLPGTTLGVLAVLNVIVGCLIVALSKDDLVLCYPLVPLGFAALYITRPSIAAQREPRGSGLVADLYHEPLRAAVMFDKFWTAVLLATLFCYAVYPFFPLTPPRVLFNDVPGPTVPPLLRNMNLWVLDRFSVQACLFPSAHAAAVTATALAVRAYMPRLGILFCIAALSVAAATVYGRYH
jgi:hypothetical protein